jgi:hypothetical protein
MPGLELAGRPVAPRHCESNVPHKQKLFVVVHFSLAAKRAQIAFWPKPRPLRHRPMTSEETSR